MGTHKEDAPADITSCNVEINSALLAQYRNEYKIIKSPEEEQATLDEIFTPERRKRMLQAASADKFGRKVRYFRDISHDAFIKLITEGSQTALSYNPNPDANVPEQVFKYYLSEYLYHHLEPGSERLKEIQRTIRKPLIKIVEDVFKDSADPKEIEKLLKLPTYRTVHEFISKHVSLKFQQIYHRGGPQLTGLSPLLSMSAGGVSNLRLFSSVILEIIMPDKRVMPNPTGVVGEKEVHTRKITLSDISRVYRDEGELVRAEVINPDAPVYKYYKNLSGYHFDPYQDAIEQWRWKEPTEDYLPVSFLK